MTGRRTVTNTREIGSARASNGNTGVLEDAPDRSIGAKAYDGDGLDRRFVTRREWHAENFPGFSSSDAAASCYGIYEMRSSWESRLVREARSALSAGGYSLLFDAWRPTSRAINTAR